MGAGKLYLTEITVNGYPKLSVNIGKKIRFKNPVLTASGTFGYGLEYAEYLDINSLGGIVVKGLSAKPQQGNEMPRIFETSAGMLNAVGLQNIGADEFIKKKLPLLKKYDTRVIVNFFGYSIKEYCDVVKKLNNADGITALEMNISCPNIKQGGIAFGSDPSTAFKVISTIRKLTQLPLIVKLSPNVSDIASIAKSAEDAGADAVSLINTLLGMAINIKTKRSRLANITGGLSGPAIKPIAVRMVWQAARAVKIPVIGIGGIMTAEDAIEFIIAGAKAVQIGTANFSDPSIPEKIVRGIRDYCLENKIKDINQLIGSFLV